MAENTSHAAQMEAYQKEAEARIAEMEAEGYSFPKKFSKGDWIGAIALVIVCALFMIAGNWM